MESKIHSELRNYMVYEDGRIFSVKRQKFLKPSIDRYGYLRVTLFKNNVRHYLTVHRIVGILFVPNPDNKEQINHKDGNKLNNHKNNLEWSTLQENIQHSIDNNLKKNFISGVEHYLAKVSEDTVREIRMLKEKGFRNKQIEIKTGLHRNIVSRIVTGKSYKNVK